MTAVIFDLDGVLVDSEPYWQQGFADVVNDWAVSAGHPSPELTAADMHQYAGGRVNETLEDILTRGGHEAAADRDLVATLTERVVARVSGLFAERPTPIEASVQTARALHARGERLAVCSSSAGEFIDAVLNTLGLEDAFEVRRSALLIEHGKPHPQVYLETLEDLGLAASECVAIEDSPRGIGSAVAAGIPCIGLWTGAEQPPAEFDACVLVTRELSTGDIEAAAAL